jgi:hypothetical protein
MEAGIDARRRSRVGGGDAVAGPTSHDSAHQPQVVSDVADGPPQGVVVDHIAPQLVNRRPHRGGAGHYPLDGGDQVGIRRQHSSQESLLKVEGTCRPSEVMQARFEVDQRLP